jgi:hypothetical protein
MCDDADDLPVPSRRPRLTPTDAARFAPLDARSRESYEAAEAAVAAKVETGAKLDELLALVGDDGAVPQAMLELSDSTIHRIAVVNRPKPSGGG